MTCRYKILPVTFGSPDCHLPKLPKPLGTLLRAGERWLYVLIRTLYVFAKDRNQTQTELSKKRYSWLMKLIMERGRLQAGLDPGINTIIWTRLSLYLSLNFLHVDFILRLALSLTLFGPH